MVAPCHVIIRRAARRNTRGKGGAARGFESRTILIWQCSRGAGGSNLARGWRTLNSFTRNRKENKWGYDRTLLQRFGASASLQEIEYESWTASIDGALLDRGRNPHFFLALRVQKRRGVLDFLMNSDGLIDF
jgi:hypothetical protein